jgi:NAD(P)-dependent dehydrogenase (short-subunit alcohol dehydrogenase family)
LGEEGATVIAVSKTEAKLEEATAGMSHVAARFAVDLSDEAAVRIFAEDLRAKALIIHGLVHAAGVHALRPLKILGADELLRMYQSHVVSSVALCRHLLGTRVWCSSGGSAVFLSSAAALRSGSGTIAYGAAKAALLAAVGSMAVELASRGLRVNAISPGVVCTPQSEAFLATLLPEQRDAVEAQHLLGLGRPADVAAAACFLLSDDARWITGANLVVDGGLTLR